MIIFPKKILAKFFLFKEKMADTFIIIIQGKMVDTCIIIQGKDRGHNYYYSRKTWRVYFLFVKGKDGGNIYY